MHVREVSCLILSLLFVRQHSNSLFSTSSQRLVPATAPAMECALPSEMSLSIVDQITIHNFPTPVMAMVLIIKVGTETRSTCVSATKASSEQTVP